MDMPGPVRLVSLVTDAEWERHIRDTVGVSSIIRWIRRESDLEPSDGLEAANVVLWQIAPAPNAVSTLCSTFWRLRTVIPLSPIVLYCHVAPAVAELVLLGARLGIHRAALRGYDDISRVLADAVHEHRYSRACDEILAHIPHLDDRVLPVMAYSVRHAFDCALSVDDLATAFQVDRKTLHNHLRRGGLPAAAALISWSRLLAAGWLLEDPKQTVANVAQVLRFASASELRGMLSRYVHATATQLRVAGALAAIIKAFCYDGTRPCKPARRRSVVTRASPASPECTVVTSPRRDGISPAAD
jgi:AraC-like DNA-binding protein